MASRGTFRFFFLGIGFGGPFRVGCGSTGGAFGTVRSSRGPHGRTVALAVPSRVRRCSSGPPVRDAPHSPESQSLASLTLDRTGVRPGLKNPKVVPIRSFVSVRYNSESTLCVFRTRYPKPCTAHILQPLSRALNSKPLS